MNANLKLLDAIVQVEVLSATTSVPPGSPPDGDRYIVPSDPAPTGDWAGKEGQVMVRQEAIWKGYIPNGGWRAFVRDDDSYRQYSSEEGLWLFAPGSRTSGAVVNLPIDSDFFLASDPVLASNRMLVFTDTGGVLTQERIILLPNIPWALWKMENRTAQPLNFRRQDGGVGRVIQSGNRSIVSIMDGLVGS